MTTLPTPRQTAEPLGETYTLNGCEVCGAPPAPGVLDLGLQPMCDDLVRVGEDRVCLRYPIEISLCPTCLTAHQVHRIRKETLFPDSYHYRPRFTQDVLDGMAGLVDEVETVFGPVANRRVVDVGCNDGSLLSIFRRRGAVTAGIEPTGAAGEAEAAGHLTVPDFFSPQSAETLVERFGHPDVVTFTNVFAHIESLPEAIEAVRKLVHDGSVVVIENHYLGTVLDTFQFDTFYHEHPRTYSRRSFDFIADAMGGEVLHVSFPNRYGGNIRVAIGNFGSRADHRPTPPSPGALRDENEFPDLLAKMQTDMTAWVEQTRQGLDELKAAGVRMCGKSFPGRAAILAHLLQIDSDDQPVVYEKPGSLKIGHYLPGTRIEILGDEYWMENPDQPDALFLWGWHIAGELSSYLRKAGFRGRLYTPLPRLRELP